MQVQKKFLKTCAVLMAAAMAASPVTVRAEEAVPAEAVNRIAEGNIVYKISSAEEVSYEADYDRIGMEPVNLLVAFDSYPYDSSYADASYMKAVPEGYKSVSTVISSNYDYNADYWPNRDYARYYWRMEAENSRDWTRVDQGDVPAVAAAYNFTVDCGGVTYTECWASCWGIDGGADKAVMIVPQQYEGALTFTVYGNKIENGELVKDETSYITRYLQAGSGLTTPAQAAVPQAADPAADSQPTDPSADQPTQQPLVTERQGTVYVTKAGDSLMKIAKELYGDKEQWTAIYELNKDLIKNPNVIYANMQLQLP